MLTAVENQAQEESPCSLDELAREGARRMLQSAQAEEFAAYIERQKNELNERGRHSVVRNGKARARKGTCARATQSSRHSRLYGSANG